MFYELSLVSFEFESRHFYCKYFLRVRFVIYALDTYQHYYLHEYATNSNVMQPH